MRKVGNKLVSWDESEIWEFLVNRVRKDWTDDEIEEAFDCKREDLEDEDIYNYYGNTDEFTFEWENTVENLQYYIDKKLTQYQKKNKYTYQPDYWYCTVNNFGWTNQNGHKYFQSSDAEEFLRSILPDCDCTFYIFNYGNGFAIQNYHHDSPVGNEWYYIIPVGAKTFEKNNQ